MPETKLQSSFIYNESSRTILKTLNSVNNPIGMTTLHEKIPVNYTTTGKTVSRLEEKDLLTTEVQGREKKAEPTDKGIQIAHKLEEIQELNGEDKVFNKASRMILKITRKNSMYGSLDISEICDKIDVNYNSTGTTVNQLKRHGLLITEESGRAKQVKLTSAGKKTADRLMEITELIRG
jgi:predicted transcriptional regulator